MISPEQVAWLTANKGSYEFYLLHAMFHDPGRRSALTSIPLVAKDFDEQVALAAILQGMVLAIRTCSQLGSELAYPPDPEVIMGFMKAASREKESLVSEQEAIDSMDTVRALVDESYRANWFIIDPLLTTWLTSVRLKQYARKVAVTPVADADSVALAIARDSRAAQSAVFSPESDGMYQMQNGVDDEMKERHSTGFAGLDIALNGGTAPGECYLVFSGTGGGKSVIAGQVSYHHADIGGYALVLSTELGVPDYVVRIVANHCHIPISDVQDCKNYRQLRAVIASKHPASMDKLEKVLKVIDTRMRFVKLHPDMGLTARAVMEKEFISFEHLMGVPPTFVAFDWLGRVADQGGAKTSSDRVLAWERAADSCVQFADVKDVATMVLAQATNDAHLQPWLGLEHIGISKGIGRQMTAAIGVTNLIDKAKLKQMIADGGDKAFGSTLDEQGLCMAKARKGEGTYIPIKRQMRYQRFTARAF